MYIYDPMKSPSIASTLGLSFAFVSPFSDGSCFVYQGYSPYVMDESWSCN